MDSRKCQTSTATPPEAGGLPCLARQKRSLFVMQVRFRLGTLEGFCKACLAEQIRHAF